MQHLLHVHMSHISSVEEWKSNPVLAKLAVTATVQVQRLCVCVYVCCLLFVCMYVLCDIICIVYVYMYICAREKESEGD